MPRGEAVTGGAQCTAAAERRHAGTVEQWARQGDGGVAVRGVGEGQREEIGCVILMNVVAAVLSSPQEEDTCGPQPMLASIVYIEAIASMYHSGILAGVSHAGVPAC
eukprot:COSAG01_NODE_836_length_13206_cov_139.627375_2_plen_107_part_00